ncbi:MAG: molybdopterin molybdotransferase MoeA [Armatimonadetes bacterium]|nr:molybdopterin molybdotransferase MoeA [Armatimonadota bacterium]
MIRSCEALSIIRLKRPRLETIELPLSECNGRILGKDYSTDWPIPSFDNSAMDGFVVGGAVGPWTIVGEIPAGTSEVGSLGCKDAVRIYTGAPVPDGAFGVIPVEQANAEGQRLRGEVSSGAHIRRSGEEVAEGTTILRRGVLITPPIVGALAALGIPLVQVERAPLVGVVSTGNELAEPGSERTNGQIFNSNTITIQSTLRQWGISAASYHANDSIEELTTVLQSATNEHDLVVTCGGVSAGAYDFVPKVMRDLHYEVAFQGVAIKPGKPLVFGTRRDGKAWFGLPGNPMSAWIGLLIFISEYLGHPLHKSLRVLASDHRRKPGREEYLPAKVAEHCEIELQQTVGSHSNFSLVGADGLAIIPSEAPFLSKGSKVEFLAFPWQRTL